MALFDGDALVSSAVFARSVLEVVLEENFFLRWGQAFPRPVFSP